MFHKVGSIVAFYQITARQFKTTFGLSHAAYTAILPRFTELAEADKTAQQAARAVTHLPKRKAGGSRPRS